jgi:beta-galactosidase
MKKIFEKKQFTAFLFLLMTAALFAQSSRQTELFDRGWKFHFGNAGNPSKDFDYRIANIFAKSGKAEGTAIDPKFDDSQWHSLDLPHDWAVELPFVESKNADVDAHGYKTVGGLFPETSVGWYRKHFPVSRADSGKRFTIRFDGVFRDACFWLNGFYLGRNESGYLGVTWDVTDYVKFGRENVLVVRADASQYEGWFYEGAGIYRHVWFSVLDNLHFAENGIYIHATLDGNTAEVSFETTIKNNYSAPVEAVISCYLLDRERKQCGTIATMENEMEGNSESGINQVVTLKDPHRWSVNDPYLYCAVVVLKNEDQTVDSLVTRIGLRTIVLDPQKGLFLNGENIKVMGVNCHQDHAGVGSAIPDYLQYYRVRLLKEMGVNAYRTSHNAPAPELLDACDSLGMLVLDEQRLLNSSPEYLWQLDRLVMRDRNHPSVFLWSIGNEEGYLQTNGNGKRIALSLMTRLKQLDPTRTCTYAADLGNVFTGVNEVIPVRGFNYREKFVAEYHRDHPNQPVVGTEMGSTVTTRGIYEKDTVRCYVPDQDITAPWWASTAEQWWTLCAAQPGWMGGFVWTGLDYRGEPTPYRWPNINSHFGIMDMCGFPKNIYYYYKSWWSSDDVIHISPHWNWPGKEGTVIPVWVNSNAEKVELFLNGKSLGSKEMPRNGHLVWDVPYQPGKLEAKGIRNGKKIACSVETTGKPVRILLSPDKTLLSADGRDATVINISVIDEKGREVPDAGNLVRFKATGNGAIIGVGNGDPSSHEADKCPASEWQRKLFSGKCQVIVQAGYEPGTLRFEATSDGLTSGQADITVR